MGSLELICWNQNRDNRWAPANEIVVCALAPPTSGVLKSWRIPKELRYFDRKHNKEYRLHVARHFCMLWKTLSLILLRFTEQHLLASSLIKSHLFDTSSFTEWFSSLIKLHTAIIWTINDSITQNQQHAWFSLLYHTTSKIFILF